MVRILRDWRDTFARTGTPWPKALTDPRVVDRLNEDLFAFETGRLAEDVFFARYARVTGLSVREVTACFTAWMVRPQPGIDALIDNVAGQDVRTACLSNTNPLHWRVMHEPGPCRLPVDRLDHHYTSFDIGVMKPDEAIYAHVEKDSGVAPSDILFFDDVETNIHAARQRGWRAVRVDPQDDPVGQMADVLRRFAVAK